MKLPGITVVRGLRLGSIAIATSALVACGGGGGGSSPTATIKGTAAVGSPLANATIQMVCKNGSTNATTDGNGAFSATFAFDAPCVLTASGGTIVIHSLASGAGTYNLTSLTDLLLSYIAGQLGTTLNGLLTGIQNNPSFQGALSNSAVIANAETAVAKLVKADYGVTLSTSAFLTTPFVPGQPGPDADLDALQNAGAVSATTGSPVPALASAALAAGAKAPISGGGGKSPTGGTGGSGAT
ncbi:hypothetical protein B0G81_8010 [Paraburkholderia sp. BL6665CI2N2]|uniref:carboxypeptidase regulatory-like domain-containing protein n=1 Tax=Paraburkholderia sp. BL6665CI2N2 TaxID=1938806 RepID=UPI001065DC2E|nr:carboxypeptidase regulatory-like domain-containing protein [Paraburkholderia sp. BL6665CI2N2]TDY16881.1 hypothetical protein B0G81_8010 [Paraburkholderia sp. BL6665CI2N2]